MSAPIQLLPSNPKANYLSHKEEIDAIIGHVLNSGRYILGDELIAFEKEFADYIGVRFGIGVGSGTEALHLALRACGIGKGDEVITVSHTAVATVAAIELCGAMPVLVDIDLNTYTIDPGQIESVITKRTKAIIPVHLYGHSADIESVMSIANHYELKVIEDCAQSHGAVYKDRMTGGWGHIAAFSFYPTKNLGAIGDGGMVVTDDPNFAEMAMLLREYGWRERYISEFPGLNSRMDELQAGILRVKLRYLDEENRKRRELANLYGSLLAETTLSLPHCQLDSWHVYHQYVVRSSQRDGLRDYLKEMGIGTLIHYPVPIHLQPSYRGRLGDYGTLPKSEQAASQVLSLPMFPELLNRNIHVVCQAIIEWERKQGAES